MFFIFSRLFIDNFFKFLIVDCCFSNLFVMLILENFFLLVFKRIVKSLILDRFLVLYVIKCFLGFLCSVILFIFNKIFFLKEIKVGDKLMKLL